LMSLLMTEPNSSSDYEVAETLAPTWERRRADIEGASAPVREWMLRELAPQRGDTVLELAAGTGTRASRRHGRWANGGD
jgi:hypothetical protein